MTRVRMIAPITLAVVSDLHIGHRARAKDLCPYPDSEAVESDYRGRFLQFIRKHRIRADYLIIPGDVGDRGKPAEFQMASAVVSEIAGALNVSLDRALFVPGNHDVDWAFLEIADPTGFYRAQRYEPLNDQRWLFRGIMGHGRGDLLTEPYYSVWEFPDLVVFGYNSSWHDDPAVPNHPGLMAQESLERLEQQLDAAPLSESKVRVFLVHHHPILYSEPIPDDHDFSAMTNAGNLLKLLRHNHFDLLIHGHKHKPNFETHIIDSSFPLGILCAGSFSAELDTRWSGHVNNQFHLIRIVGRDIESRAIIGTVESWTYLCGRGWGPSEANNGIRHKIPFGPYVLPDRLREELRRILGERLEMGEYVEWTNVVSAMPQLAYVGPALVIEVLDSLEEEVGFRRYGVPPDVILLRKAKGDGKS